MQNGHNMYHSFLIHSCADGHLGCFHVLSIINSASTNIGVNVSLSILVWKGSLCRSILLDWRRQWQPSLVFLPGESHGWGSLVGCHLWDCTESDMTEVTWQQQQQHGMLRLIYAFYTTTYLSHHVSVTTSQINIQQESRILSL